ncbi:MAG TPA: hypothetical protein VEG68_01550 [Terriglobales bacterium]|nr:hypothetical protein [Terriglobales bacterium]
MAKFAQPNTTARAPRVKLVGTVLILLLLENGRQLRGRLHQLSVSGGLLQLDKPLDEGIKVELVFHVGQNTVRGKARMLFPMWATQGCLQPFEFDSLSAEDIQKLQADLQKLLDSSALSARSSRDDKPVGLAPHNPA